MVPSEPSIWTERMLSALEMGVKGGKWFSLSDKTFSAKTLEASFRKVKANGGSSGIDRVTIAQFEKNLDEEIARLSKSLMDGTYRPQAIKRAWIPKPGSKEKRPLGIPTVRDRVVQGAIRFALEPIFEREFCDGSFGFRPGRSCHKALRRVWTGLKTGRAYVLDADLKKCFDTIPHGLIMRGLEERVSDGTLLNVIVLFLKQGVMQFGDGEAWEAEPTEGTPQGSVISPLLANIALHGLDLLAESQGLELIRYADDFVVLCKDRDEAESALVAVKSWVDSSGMSLHPEKTRVVDFGAGESFEFLGYEFKKDFVYPKRKSIQNLRDKVRAETPRTSGRSLAATISKLNPILSGWYRYFRYSRPSALREADQFVRRRLRSILGRWRGKRGFPGGHDNNRWPKAFFHERGLFSMEQAHAKAQSSKR
jgi:RNA-directed DNA polymerase